MDPKQQESDTKSSKNEETHPFTAVWNWITELMDDSLAMKGSYAQKTCQNFNVNTYAPVQTMASAHENCLDLQENDEQLFTIEESEVDTEEDLL